MDLLTLGYYPVSWIDDPLQTKLERKLRSSDLLLDYRCIHLGLI